MSISRSCIRGSSFPVRVLRQNYLGWRHNTALRYSNTTAPSAGPHVKHDDNCGRPLVFAKRYVPVLMVEDGELKNKPVYDCKGNSDDHGGGSGNKSNDKPCKKRVCSSKGDKPSKKPKKKEEKPCGEKSKDQCVQMSEDKGESHCAEECKDPCDNKEKRENSCEEKRKDHCVQMTGEKDKSHCEEKCNDPCDDKEKRENSCEEKRKDHCVQMTDDCENKSKDVCAQESEKCDRASEDKCRDQAEDCAEKNKCAEPEVGKRSNICIRESAAPVQFIRDFLLGRAYTNALRAPDVMTARTQPPPCLPLGPHHKYCNNYYYARNARGEVKPPRAIELPQPCDADNEEFSDFDDECEEIERMEETCP